MKKNVWSAVLMGACILPLAACTTPPKVQKDISAYQNHMPRSILVLPPVNDTPDTRAYYGYWSTVARPVAEAGYYVFPLSVVETMFKENGITNGHDAQAISPQKLQEIFGADAALYIRIKEYGSKYQVLQTTAIVAAEAKLVDLKTGTILWEGKQQAVQASDGGNNGLAGMLISAIVDQVANHLQDRAHMLSHQLNQLLFTPKRDPGVGLLYGPRSPNFQQDGVVK